MTSFNRKLWIISAALSLVTTLLVCSYLSNINKPVKEELATVYIAAQDIAPRKVITKSMIKKEVIPASLVHPKAITNENEIIGKTTSGNFVSGEQIISKRLSSEQNDSLAFIIPPGKRAITISANEIILIGNLVNPGDCVDILVTLDKEEVKDNETITRYPQSTRIILQNIQVLAVGQNMSETRTNGKEIPKSITLAVTPTETEKLILAEETGRIRLALRPSIDNELIVTPGAIREDISVKRGIMIESE